LPALEITFYPDGKWECKEKSNAESKKIEQEARKIISVVDRTFVFLSCF
jgi:hypothetical protein